MGVSPCGLAKGKKTVTEDQAINLASKDRSLAGGIAAANESEAFFLQSASSHLVLATGCDAPVTAISVRDSYSSPGRASRSSRVVVPLYLPGASDRQSAAKPDLRSRPATFRVGGQRPIRVKGDARMARVDNNMRR